MVFGYFRRKAKENKLKSTANSKALLRQQIGGHWFSMTNKIRSDKSLSALSLLKRLLDELQAKTVLFYASMGDEPSTDSILQDWLLDTEARLVLTRPCVKTKQLDPLLVASFDDLEIGRFGIRMPKNTCPQVDLIELDAIVVPGRAFDAKKNRLGRGYGFYDRFLSVIPKKVRKIGLGFDFQIKKELPVEEHDVPMDVIITESGIIR